MLCCVARSFAAVFPRGELNSPNDDARRLWAPFLLLLLQFFIFCRDGVRAAVTLISPPLVVHLKFTFPT